jgi:hypothetical protein
LSFTPLARDNRSIFGPLTYIDTVGWVVDGLIAAGVFAERRDITDLIVRSSTVCGVDGLEVAVLPPNKEGTHELHPEHSRV